MNFTGFIRIKTYYTKYKAVFLSRTKLYKYLRNNYPSKNTF